MKTSILLAAYNGRVFLPEQLESLQSQSDGDFTVLMQDDGSSDGTRELLEETARKDPRFMPAAESGRHLGACGNFLSLLRQTDADAVLLCDQDDRWEPEKIAVLKNALLEASRRFGAETPLLIHTDASVTDENGNVLYSSLFRHQGWDPAAVTLPRLLVQNNVTGCTVILNRPLIDLVVRTARADTLFMHDWWIALTAAAFGRVIFLDRPLVCYRQHGANSVGASASGQLSRGMEALGRRKRARQRIALTYTHAEAFRDQCGSMLPPEAAGLIQAYLDTRSLPKIRRVRQVFRLGCTMQSPVTRLGQIFFG